jgi:hypothetical protein
MKLTKLKLLVAPALGLLFGATGAAAFWADGDGHYALRGATEQHPAFQHGSGIYQAVEQSFRLTGEARFNDQLSLFLELGIFDDPRRAYMGDVGQPQECPNNTTGTTANPCSGQHQNTGEPGYKAYAPRINKAFVRYAFDYCILDAGRRGRNWGLGMFLDDGSKPFATSASVFDGVTCNVNLQKSQTLGFSIGYDKLAETGTPVDPNWRKDEPGTASRGFGPNDQFDDLDQYFFTVEYDDRKANAGSFFTKQIGLYFAQVKGADYKVINPQRDPNDPAKGTISKETGGDGTDLKFLDLYTGFYVGDLAIKNEVLFRMGKSSDPSWTRLGGASANNSTSELPSNKLDSVALAGNFEWTIAHSGAALGPAEFNKGDMKRHVLFVNYAYAPGDSDGYRNFDDAPAAPASLAKAVTESLTRGKRSTSVKAIELNRNFKPALLLFNAHPDADYMVVDGSFNPSRMVNATLFGAGYRYESMETGNFEAKLLTASLNEGPPREIRDYYNAIKDSKADLDNNGQRPAGFYGRSLGYELDLSYSYRVGREVELGVAGAVALPGKAWQVRTGSSAATDLLLQTSAIFHF